MLVSSGDKRVFSRMNVESDVKYRVSNGAETFHGQLLNLSAEGISFRSSRQLVIDTQISIEVISSGGVPPLVASGLVLRCDEMASDDYHIACSIKICG
ncbi:PilZ domain-containing protein [Psychrobium sp. 1_MG-2023]|uniref:PilZ domain-containing protein n=1 Tax=Psychrobium sp. 1_MG-2023 TaxID=3062624 RepID=UPI000C3418DF|nr:PilZ domain-containing protein [Psychrobium sp. 1_MG-2023]MDP2562017.1 PilZ domain-containing protein [Psychrobium sp. 1_MG-2023]PKF58504.1 hypothetical protein CW748_03425 [Alteromonadales bacterium alter-6D02]